MPSMKTTQQMRDELLLRGKDVLPFSVEDSTTMPIPGTFGGIKTSGRLFHGGAWQGPEADKQGALIAGKPATSYTRNPYEALEYASVPNGKVVSVSHKGLNIYRGGNPDLDKAYRAQGAAAVARAGYDGVDVRALTGGGYNEVVVWNHDKVKDIHSAPVETTMEGVGLAHPLKKHESDDVIKDAKHPSIPQTWYRGQVGEMAHMGPFEATAIGAPSFADSPEVASTYATNPDAAGLYGMNVRPENYAANPNVAPYKVAGKIFDARSLQGGHGTKTGLTPSAVKTILRKLKVHENNVLLYYSGKYGSGSKTYWDAADENLPNSRKLLPAYQLFDSKAIHQALKDQGYSGVLFHGVLSDPSKATSEMPWSEDVVHHELKVVKPGSLQSTISNQRYADGGAVSPMAKTIQQMRDELLLRGLAGGGEVKASVSPYGFYSPVEQAAMNIQRKAGNAQAFMNDLRTVPRDQLAHTGIEDLLKSKPVITREEVRQHIAQNKPDIQEVVLQKQKRTIEQENDYHDLYRREYRNEPLTPEEAARLAKYQTPQPGPKYDDPKYRFSRGKNYREVLLTLPVRAKDSKGWQDYRDELIGKGLSRVEADEVRRWGAGAPLGTVDPAAIAKASDLMGEGWMAQYRSVLQQPNKRVPVTENSYRSSHWDQPNVLAHIRMSDHKDAEGKKTLFIEEIQSDWGQDGKKYGFRGQEGEPLTPEQHKYALQLQNQERNTGVPLTPQQQAELNTLMAKHERSIKGMKVPNAPFVGKTNDWVNLALKHILKKAAQEGHEKVAFIDGYQSADRYSLDKHLSSLYVTPTPRGDFNLQMTLKDGRREMSPNVPRDKLENYVGHEMAQKILEQNGGSFEGRGLRMPHKGMRDFYDTILPNQVHALIKKYGGQLETVHFNYPQENTPAEQLGFTITPEMRQAILKPMSYAQGGAVPTMDHMRLAVMDQKFPQMGINVTTDHQAGRRYADLIVDGHKTYETRNSDSLRPYVGKRVAIVRTGEGRAKAIGAVTVGEPVIADKRKFNSMRDGHMVPEGSKFDLKSGVKFLYPMIKPERFDEEHDVAHGIISRRLISKKDGGAVDSLSEEEKYRRWLIEHKAQAQRMAQAWKRAIKTPVNPPAKLPAGVERIYPPEAVSISRRRTRDLTAEEFARKDAQELARWRRIGDIWKQSLQKPLEPWTPPPAQENVSNVMEAAPGMTYDQLRAIRQSTVKPKP